MNVTVVNEWWFKKDGDLAEGRAAASELVEYFKKTEPAVQLSLWLEDRNDPLHHYHITVFDSRDAYLKIRESTAIKRFVQRLFPQVVRDQTFRAPECKAWLSSGGTLTQIN